MKSNQRLYRQNNKTSFTCSHLLTISVPRAWYHRLVQMYQSCCVSEFHKRSMKSKINNPILIKIVNTICYVPSFDLGNTTEWRVVGKATWKRYQQISSRYVAVWHAIIIKFRNTVCYRNGKVKFIWIGK